MTNLQTSKEDEKESLKVSQLLRKVEQMDAAYADKESNLIHQQQPFLLSLLIGYRMDVKPFELEEIMRIIFLIWEYFKDYQQVRQRKITETQFFPTLN